MNWDKVFQLLSVAEKVVQWPKLSALGAAALAELEKELTAGQEQLPLPSPPSRPSSKSVPAMASPGVDVLKPTAPSVLLEKEKEQENG